MPEWETEAYRRGVEEAEKDMASRPKPDGTVSVSLDHDEFGNHDPYDHIYFKMCQRCTWAIEHCTCEEES